MHYAKNTARTSANADPPVSADPLPVIMSLSSDGQRNNHRQGGRRQYDRHQGSEVFALARATDRVRPAAWSPAPT